MNALMQPELSLEAYLAWENQQPTTNEFHRGLVLPVADMRRVNGCVRSNLLCELANSLGGSGCQVFSGSMKVQIEEDTVLYPDLFVTCDSADLRTEMIFRSPTVVFEIVSPATQAYKRSQKFAHYRRIPALKEYILVDPDTHRVEAFRLNADGQWVLHDLSDGESLEVASMGVSISMRDVFDGVDPPPPEPAAAA